MNSSRPAKSNPVAFWMTSMLVLLVPVFGQDTCSTVAPVPDAQIAAAAGMTTAERPLRSVTSSNSKPAIPVSTNGGVATSGLGQPLGPVKPENIRVPSTVLPPGPLREWSVRQRLRSFGWVNGGYTASSTGEGLLDVEPRENRFGQTWLLNEAAIVLERTLDREDWSWGFRTEFYMGADAALLHPVDGFGPSHDEKFGTDFRQLYASFHAPILAPGGVDVLLGRQYVPLGYETTMAPYRPMYSQGYAWIYSQNGATTGAIATMHVSPDLDIIAGTTLGVNSLFDFRGRAPSYISRGVYWLGPSRRTKLVGTVYTGPEPIAAAKGHLGRWETEVELQAVHDVNRRLTLVSETNLGSDTKDPANAYHTSRWYGTSGFAIVHANRLLDVNTRVEWFDDVDGSRIGTRGTYGEITSGINFMPARALNFRPEVRWDVAGSHVFGPDNSVALQSHQWTIALDGLLKS